MLLPFPCLYRHGLALRAQGAINYFGRTRVTYVDGHTQALRNAASAEWLRSAFGGSSQSGV